MTKHTFKAYDTAGRMVLSTWTRVPVAYLSERAAFQRRLNSDGQLSHVDICSSDPKEPLVRLMPRKIARPQLTVVR
jgi:hypothetical protein